MAKYIYRFTGVNSSFKTVKMVKDEKYCLDDKNFTDFRLVIKHLIDNKEEDDIFRAYVENIKINDKDSIRPTHSVAKYYKLNLLQISDVMQDGKKPVDLFIANEDSDDYCVIIQRNGVYYILINKSYYGTIEE